MQKRLQRKAGSRLLKISFLMRNEIENKLMNKNTKPTSMRILVYDFLDSQDIALSLSEIENQFENADRITIYRTLKTLLIFLMSSY